NDAYGGSSATDRNAYLDYVTIATAAGTAAPTPTPAATSGGGTLFSDGFESGDFSAWSAVKSGTGGAATVQSSVVKSGSHAAQLSETSTAGSYASVRKTLATAQTNLTVAGDFETTAEGARGSNVRFVRLFDPSGALVVSLYRLNGRGMVGLQYPSNGSYY